ncbi:MAG: hypothetical protein KGL39_41645 [Patescibacteria group bacterium]|nr:hypothetical protein [Patescibacteria group bacterium]
MGLITRALRAAYWQPMGRYLDWRFGRSDPPWIENRFKANGAFQHYSYHYPAVAQTMRLVDVCPDDVLVDVGCSAGRVLNWWLHAYPHNRIAGIELDPQIGGATAARLLAFKNARVFVGDAVELTPVDATICYLANPFNGDMLARWQTAVLARCQQLRLLVYVNPKFREALNSQAWSFTFHGDIEPQVLLCERHAATSLPL